MTDACQNQDASLKAALLENAGLADRPAGFREAPEDQS